MSQHLCHALECKTPVPPEMLMCRRHWYMVPKSIRDRVWQSYRHGQCDDKQPSREWLKAAIEAENHVALKEKIITEEKAAQRLSLFDPQRRFSL